jgi:trehalose 6-phosphate synthase
MSLQSRTSEPIQERGIEAMTTTPITVLSNRGPLSFSRAPDGSLEPKRGGGGLVSGFLDVLTESGGTWISAISHSADVEAASQGRFVLPPIELRPTVITPKIYHDAYDVIANRTLWFLYHGLYSPATTPIFDAAYRSAFENYRSYNRALAQHGVAAPSDARLVINDYHLALVPGYLRQHRPDLRTCFFTHTPSPTADEFRMLPKEHALELVSSMAAADRIGFHCTRWAENFRETAHRLGIQTGEIFVSPLPSDHAQLSELAESEEVKRAERELDKLGIRGPLIVRVDRMELSKNIVRGFLAIEELLERHPETRGNFHFLALCYPSRETMHEYRSYGELVRETAERINERYGNSSWQPIILRSEDNYPRSIAALKRYDLLLVNPIRDGLNLVAQEGIILNRNAGSVLLSREAGAAERLESLVDLINPFDISETAESIFEALFHREAAERSTRAQRAQASLVNDRPSTWLATLLEGL